MIYVLSPWYGQDRTVEATQASSQHARLDSTVLLTVHVWLNEILLSWLLMYSVYSLNLLMNNELIVTFHGEFRNEHHPMFCTGKLHWLYNLPPHSIVGRVSADASCIINCTRVSTFWRWNNSRLLYLFHLSPWIGVKIHYHYDDDRFCKFRLISISSTFPNLWKIFLPNCFFSYVTFCRPVGRVVAVSGTLPLSPSISSHAPHKHKISILEPCLTTDFVYVLTFLHSYVDWRFFCPV